MSAGTFITNLSKYGKIKRPTKTTWQRFLHSLVRASRPTIWGVRLDELGGKGVILAALFILSNVVVFVTILSINISRGRGNKFVAMVRPPGADCSEVPRAIKGNFAASFDGFWETSERFLVNRSLLMLEFGGKGITTSQYRLAMRRFSNKMAELGRIGTNRSCRYSLTTLASLNLYDAETDLRLYSNVDSGIAFNGVVTTTSLSSAAGVCTGQRGGKLTSYFDSKNKQVVMRMPLPRTSINNSIDSVCPKHLPSEFLNDRFGYFVQSYLKYVEFGFDIRATALVVGLNAGVITTEGLVVETSVVADKHGMIGYIDPLYADPAMPPIYCLDKRRTFQVYNIRLSKEQLDGAEICFLASSFKFARVYFFYPSMNQVRFDPPAKGHILAADSQKTAVIEEWRIKGVNNTKFTSYATCRCPNDQFDPYCNQGMYFVSYFYGQNVDGKRTFNLPDLVSMAVKTQLTVAEKTGTGTGTGTNSEASAKQQQSTGEAGSSSSSY
jgi:hypothetical protein